jgi:dTDP-4-dehydrorhamnose 3,5-epimerase
MANLGCYLPWFIIRQLTDPSLLAASRSCVPVFKAMGSSLRFTPTEVLGAVLIDPVRREDNRGHFSRAWCLREFAEHGIDFVPVQENMGFSLRKGTLRGMHFQDPPALEAKLVRCTRGAIFDVVLDLRPKSPSYGKWYGAELTPENGRIMYIPQHCGHGYQTLVDNTEMYYMASEFYTPNAVRGVRPDDPAFNIQWPLATTVISEQDRSWPLIQLIKAGDSPLH